MGMKGAREGTRSGPDIGSGFGIESSISDGTGVRRAKDRGLKDSEGPQH